MTIKLHLAQGENYHSDWTNIDKRGGDLSLDLTEGLPYHRNSVDAVFHEHFLEHLQYPKGAETFLRECNRVLKPDRPMRVCVPDAEFAIKAYVNNNEGYFQRCREKWHPDWCNTDMESINFLFRQYGEHKFAYDEDTLEDLLHRTGFAQVERTSYDESQYPIFNIDSWPYEDSLYMEAKK
jgi:predicted SAM-dependent methyltransferase